MAAPATFFEHQHVARRNTRVMLVLFLLAVVAIIVAVDAVLAGLYMWATVEIKDQMPQSVPHGLYVLGAVGTAALIFIVSLVNVVKLASGGAAVADMVGARRVTPDTRDPLERRLLNVVEEMAIASGVRVPAVYVMDDERGINAFAAGWDVSGAVVAVTRGTLEILNRNELQGVIGHEFSHIVNGDMRLNIRMIGVLAGIVFIGAIGDFIMRNVRNSDEKPALALFLAGLALFVIGYVGLFFARLIKASVSRQREFLADASSVQFTRNPDGIAGALDQIGASARGAFIDNRHAENLSHMFFGQGIRVRLSGLFDTHPPIDERIERVNPRFERLAYRGKRAVVASIPEEETGAMSLGAGGVPAPATGRRAADIGTAWGRSAGESAKLVGTLDATKMDFAARMLAALPEGLREQARDPQGAAGVVVSLMLAGREEVMAQQLAAIAAAGIADVAEAARRSAVLTRAVPIAAHLPVIDLALPALKAGPESMKKSLVSALEAVVKADRRMSLHQFVVLTLVREQLAPRLKPGAPPSRKIADMKNECALLLMLVAHAGTRPDASGARQEALLAAVRAGARQMGLAEDFATSVALSVDGATSALQQLKQLAPLQKALLVKGLFATVTADGRINVAEAEMMRLVGAVLDCPLPPLVIDDDALALAA